MALYPVGTVVEAEKIQSCENCLDCLCFILTHEATVSDYISTEDGCKLTLEILRVHGVMPEMKEPPERNRNPLEAPLS